MPVTYGKDSFFAWMKETTNGTYVAPSGSGVYNQHKTNSIGMTAERTAGNRNLGRLYERDVRLHKKRAEGDLAFDMAYQGYDHIERQLFGSGSYTGTAGSGADSAVYTGVYLLTGVDEPGASLTLEEGGYEFCYAGCVPMKGTYKFNKNDPLELALSVVGQPHIAPTTIGAATAPGSVTFLDAVAIASGNIIPTINPVEPSATNGQAFRMYVAPSPADQNSAPNYAGQPNAGVVGMYDGSITIERPHDIDRAPIGQPFIAAPLLNGFPVIKVSGSFKKDMVDKTFAQAFVSGTMFAIKLEYISGIKVKTAGALVFSKTWEMKFCLCNNPGPKVDGPGPISDDISFEAYALDGTSSPLKMTNINALAANTQ